MAEAWADRAGDAEVETNFARSDFFINGIAELFADDKIGGYEVPFATLKQPLAVGRALKLSLMLVAGGGFEPPTFGL